MEAIIIDLSRWRDTFYAEQSQNERMETMLDLQYVTTEAFAAYYRTEKFKELNRYEKDNVLGLQLILTRTFNDLHLKGLEDQSVWSKYTLEDDILDMTCDYGLFMDSMVDLVEVFSSLLNVEWATGGTDQFYKKVNQIRAFYFDILRKAHKDAVAFEPIEMNTYRACR